MPRRERIDRASEDSGASPGLAPGEDLGRTLRTSAVAAHWAVHPDTALALLRAAGVRPARARAPLRWRWEDVWRLEGDPLVHAADRALLRAPLLTAAMCAQKDPLERTAHTWRRLIRAHRLPVVRLSPTLARVRPHDLLAHAEVI